MSTYRIATWFIVFAAGIVMLGIAEPIRILVFALASIPSLGGVSDLLSFAVRLAYLIFIIGVLRLILRKRGDGE